METVIKSGAMIKELDLVALRHDAADHGLLAGDIGTVVMVHGAGEGYEVEFVTSSGETVAVLSLAANEVRPLAGREILHARELSAV
jgi:hypothetical protein